MIDPANITDFSRTECELESFALFSVLVAGKTALYVAKALDRLLRRAHEMYDIEGFRPFESLRPFRRDRLGRFLWKHGIGCHTLKSRSIHQLVRSGLDLKTCSVQDLEAIHGIGPKTARFFVLHTRKDARVAALDTHILRYMRDQGYEAPRGTPGSPKQYRHWEEVFLGLADKSGKTVAEFDLGIWNEYSRKIDTGDKT